MIDFKKFTLMMTASASLFIWAPSFAVAQEAASSEEEDTRRLGTITVTAEKREENLQSLSLIHI